MKLSRKTTARQDLILKYLQKNGRALVDDLAEKFKTTPQTIRKDLHALAEVNQIVRFHGGAALVAGTEYTGFAVRQEIARDEKERIGRVAATLVPNHSSLIINAGTTTLAVARNLSHHLGLQVVCDSVSMASEIKDFVGVEVMVPAGVVRKSDGAILGETAVDFIRQFRVDTALIGAAAISEDGALLDYDLREVAVARAIIENARNVILTVDSMKFGRAAPVCIGEIGQIDTLVTDKACPEALKAMCAENNLRLVLAD